MNTHCILLITLFASTSVLGCHSGPRAYPPPQDPTAVEVRRVAASAAHQRWQSELVRRVEDDCLNRPWIQRFIDRNGRRPVIRVKPIQNRSSKLINVVLLTQRIEAALIRSDKVQTTSGRSAAVAYEIADQQKHASDETVKATGQMVGADYLLVGWVDSPYGSPQFMVTLQLLDVVTNEKVWITLSREALSQE